MATYSRGGAQGRWGGGGTRRATCPCVRGTVSADVANTHGKRREGGEEGEDERQRLTESSKACGQTEEEDIGEEGDDAQERTVSVIGTASPEKKTKGARDGRSSAADDNSG